MTDLVDQVSVRTEEQRRGLEVQRLLLMEERRGEGAGQEERFCKRCGIEIPKGRLKALPETETCVKCSDAKPICFS